MCTYVIKACADNTCVVGRTMEFSLELDSYPIFFPVSADVPRYMPGRNCYPSRYAVAGMTAYNRDNVVDGMNDQGLQVSTLFFLGVAEYNTVTDENSYYPYEFNQLLLSQCKDVDDVINYISANNINLVDDPADPQPLHFPVTDATGRSVVIEPIGGVLVFNDNTVNVCTNSPEFTWHQKNLANYVNLSTQGNNSITFDGGYIASINGAGSGFTGLPADWTPASRFVRAAYYAQFSVIPAKGIDGVTDMFHILSTSDIVKGCITTTTESGLLIETTQYTSCSDTSTRIYYFHTYQDRVLHYLDIPSLSASYSGQSMVTFQFPASQTLIACETTA